MQVSQSIADFLKEERVQDAAVIKDLQAKLIKSGKMRSMSPKRDGLITLEQSQLHVQELQGQLAELRS